ncbi:MAG TPA: AraC family transcriptional regulator [Gammaproteobacteria bacterium]|nr:AraC family transcriptional regulator [Gammaproteobacteria bacterium]
MKGNSLQTNSGLMQHSKKHRQPWAGAVAILPGMGAFKGESGDNHEHHHWAHQLSIGLKQPVRIMTGKDTLEAKALFVRAGTPHRLLSGSVLSCYFDPTSSEAKAIHAMLYDTRIIAEPPAELVGKVLQAFDEAGSIDKGLVLLRGCLHAKSDCRDNRKLLEIVLKAVRGSLESQQMLTRGNLADLVGLSESRFSHWFREQTGMPLRSYRKWLRLIGGIEQVLAGRTLADAAYAAGFADQAHFTRTFVQMFGVKPSDVFAQITLGVHRCRG